jgi:type IV pilus assembly protein PilW
LPFSFNTAIGGYEAVNTGINQGYVAAPAPVAADGNNGDWVTSPSAPVAGLDPMLGGKPVQNNDVLVVRSTLRDAQSVYVSAIADGAPSFTVNDSGTMQNGQLAVISDCAKGVVFQITGIGPVGPNAVISHTATGAPGNSTSVFPLSFTPGSQVTPVNTVVYFIAPGADTDSSLWSYDLNATGAFTASELVPDIEAMQILYGVDTTPPTQTVSAYVTADQVTNFNTVLSVKVALLAASAPGSRHPTGAVTYDLLGTAVTAPNDTRSRQVFEETIALRDALP